MALTIFNMSPAPWPPKVGELAITLTHPKGYCVVILSTQEKYAEVTYLDSLKDVFWMPLDKLIATGKTPFSLVSKYDLDPVEWDKAIDEEMSLPDFSVLTKPKTAKTKSKSKSKSKKLPSAMSLAETIMALTPEQKDAIKLLLTEALSKKGPQT